MNKGCWFEAGTTKEQKWMLQPKIISPHAYKCVAVIRTWWFLTFQDHQRPRSYYDTGLVKEIFYAYNHSPWQCVQQWILWCSKWMTLAIRITRMFTQHTSLQDRILIRVRRMVTLHKEQVLLALTGMLHNGWEQYLFSQSRQSCFPTQKVDQKCIP